MNEFPYKAFISYSHKNSRQAAWLMKRLEAYRIPRHVGATNGAGKDQKRLGRIFRDREELPASGSLDIKLREAIGNSEFLIVVCSPDSAKSSRVNTEIRQFIEHRDSSNILCFIIEGEPNFEVPGIRSDEGCIPAELRKLHLLTGQIPLAADARSIGDGKKLALQKIVAGLLKVDLDELLRRDIRQKYRRLSVIAGASFAIALMATGLMLRANIAEDAAREALTEAELQTARAENLVSFMLEDLASTKLRQLGRVDVMDAVVAKIVDHYSGQDDAGLSTAALARKARAYTQLGRLYLGRDDRDMASSLFGKAYNKTTALLERDPQSRDALFAHLVSLYFVGTNHIFNGRYSAAEQAWRERMEVSKGLMVYNDHGRVVWGHLGDINVHLGWALMELGRTQEALEQFELGLAARQANVDRDVDNPH